MKKKLLVSVLCMALGFVMLFATAFASSTGTSGYDAYKAALKTTAAAGSLTADASLTVTDNANALLNGTLTMKANKDSDSKLSMNADLNAAGAEKSFEMFGQGNEVIVKSSDSDVYNIMPEKTVPSSKNYTEKNPEALKAGETIIDALMGDLKNYFTLTNNANGGSTVTFDISGSQIPAVVNALAALSVKNPTMEQKQAVLEGQENLPGFAQALKIEAPKLTDGIRVDEINLKAEIDSGNQITSQTLTVTISGKDAEGTAHTRTFSFNANLSGIGSTTPDTIDLTGKQTKTIDMTRVKSHGTHE